MAHLLYFTRGTYFARPADRRICRTPRRPGFACSTRMAQNEGDFEKGMEIGATAALEVVSVAAAAVLQT